MASRYFLKSSKFIFYCSLFLINLLIYSLASAYQNAIIQPIRWQGKKWEYLIEHPNQQVIDPPLFEEILDTAGLYGWELTEITDTAHFYVFYFKRPLLPHKIESQMYRLARLKYLRQQQEAPIREHVYQQITAAKEKAAHEKVTQYLQSAPHLRRVT